MVDDLVLTTNDAVSILRGTFSTNVVSKEKSLKEGIGEMNIGGVRESLMRRGKAWVS